MAQNFDSGKSCRLLIRYAVKNRARFIVFHVPNGSMMHHIHPSIRMQIQDRLVTLDLVPLSKIPNVMYRFLIMAGLSIDDRHRVQKGVQRLRKSHGIGAPRRMEVLSIPPTAGEGDGLVVSFLP